jgi:DNA uptake protein ComE-like DNA-binding protein
MGKLYLSRIEYEGMIVLFILLILLFILRVFLAHLEKKQPLIETENRAVELFFQQQKHYHDSILLVREKRRDYANNSYNQRERFEKKKLTPFPFNPDTFTFSDWRRLGLTERQTQQITNYQSKGGHFYEKTDIKKIYSITEEDYQILEPYIHITPKRKYEAKEWKKEERTISKIELNRVDSIDLQKIPGIGQKTASLIIKYREKLGGFIDINQLKEVYSIDSNRYLQISPYLYVNPNHVKKLNINKASIKELVNHPYIDYYLAKSIVVHREYHGNYTEIKEIKQITLLYEKLYQQIVPYLSVE